MKNLPSHSLRYLPGAACLLLSALAYNAQAQNQYFDVNGTTSGYGVVNGGSYSWDDANWGISGGTGATTPWVAGTFARFYGAANYTVTVNNDESMAGMYQNAGGNTLTINAAGAGDLNIVTGDQGFLSSGTTIINAPIVGVGGLAPQAYGTIYLNAANSYSGGTTWGYYGTTLVYYNNNSAFGSGPINNVFSGASVAPLLSYGGTASTPLTITLNNSFNVANNATGTGAGFNFANGSYTPVVVNGDFNAGTAGNNNMLIKNNGDSTAPLTINGNLNSSGVVTLAGNNGGTILLTAKNPNLSGTVVVGASGGAANIRVTLASANTLAGAANLTLAGGILDPGANVHSMGSTVLGLTANSTIDFSAGGAELDFANSSSTSWTGVLNLTGWDASVDALRFGTDNTGLTAAQLADIEFNGNAATLGWAQLDSNGFVIAVPEPSTMALGLLGALGAWMARRSKKA